MESFNKGHSLSKNQVAILSYGLWQRKFGGDVNVIGQSIKLDNVPTSIVGVMPSDFDFPDPAERGGGSDHVFGFSLPTVARFHEFVSCGSRPLGTQS
jgi:MacB-like periplasmic core domain